MAGYVVNVDKSEKQFHIGEPDLIRKIVEFSENSGCITLQLSGDELAAGLWGLDFYAKEATPLIPTTAPEEAIGAWVSYYHDWSGAYLFAEEIEALRHAVNHGMSVTFWEFGTENPK